MFDTTGSVLILSLVIVLGFILLFLAMWGLNLLSTRKNTLSPYTGLPLRRTTGLSFYSTEQIQKFKSSFRQYDNRPFDFNRAALCRETGRIFENCVTWYDAIRVDWTFLQKKYPGNYVSWGSLSFEQQFYIRKFHDTLEGFQTNTSSPTPAPRAIETEYVYSKPGPLYVDLNTHIVMGWKVVPGTELEVLIVQKPNI